MLRIRFSRTGKRGQPSFRVIVAEARAPIKGRHVEIVGNYLPARDPKVAELNTERITYWISKGAVPTDSVASLCKKEGMTNMEKYIINPRNLKRKKRKAGEEEDVATIPTETAKAETPAATAKEDLPAPAPSAEEDIPAPAVEDAPVEEAAKQS